MDVLIFSGGSLSNLSIDPVTLGGALLAEVRVGDALSWGWSGADSMGAFGHRPSRSGMRHIPSCFSPRASIQFVLAIVNGTPSSPSMVRTRRSRRSLIPVGITDYDIMSFNWHLKVRTFTVSRLPGASRRPSR